MKESYIVVLQQLSGALKFCKHNAHGIPLAKHYNAIVKHYLYMSQNLQQETLQAMLTGLSFIQVPVSEHKIQ